jgi:hypothetical protein
MGLPEGFSTYQVPPKLLIPWPLACPPPESAAYSYMSHPLYVEYVSPSLTFFVLSRDA